MTIAMTSIQRDRAPWLLEWLAFHLVVGFDRFYMYTHKCSDASTALLASLARRYPIVVHPFDVEVLPQLVAYQHAWNSYGREVDWMAFVDGDEFLFPVADANMADALARFADKSLSALAVYWLCYGTSGHLTDPPGLILENFTRHSGAGFSQNRHVKSIVRGGDQTVTIHGPHVFDTPLGTFDERMRPVDKGLMMELEPSYEILRMNHYVVQSWDYYVRSKRTSGGIFGCPVRKLEWFRLFDRNENDDGIRWRFLLDVKIKLREMQDFLAGA